MGNLKMNLEKDIKDRMIFVGELRGEDSKKIILPSGELAGKHIYSSIGAGMSFYNL